MQPEDYLPNDLVPMVAAAPYFLRAANIRYPLRAKEHTALGVCEAVWGRDFRWLLGQMNEAENRSLFRVAPEFGPALFMALKSTAERLHTEENERLRRNERVRRQKIADAKKTRRIMAGRCKSRENVEKPEVAFILPKEAVDPDEQIL